MLASLKKKSGPPFENQSSLGRGVADKNWKVHSSHVNDGVSPGRYMSTEIDHLKASQYVNSMQLSPEGEVNSGGYIY